MIWRWSRKKRRAHKSPPLAVVLAERDELARQVRELEEQLRAVSAGHESAWRHIEWLRRRLAETENRNRHFVPAPMDRPTTTVSPPLKPTFAAKAPNPPKTKAVVIPLHQMTRRV
ncbi:hypothetical protein STBA_10840 [Streptomyces sp. MP131-18]|nr:hypothetical protein STBA_10840 [Streptomyces sp. MP131-18]